MNIYCGNFGVGATPCGLLLSLQQRFGPQRHNVRFIRHMIQWAVGGGATNLHADHDVKLGVLGVFMWRCSVKHSEVQPPQYIGAYRQSEIRCMWISTYIIGQPIYPPGSNTGTQGPLTWWGLRLRLRTVRAFSPCQSRLHKYRSKVLQNITKLDKKPSESEQKFSRFYVLFAVFNCIVNNC